MAEPRLIEDANYPEELEAAALQVSGRLTALGIAADDAGRIAWQVAEHLRTFWGGRPTYIRAPQDKPDPRQLGLLDADGGSVPDCEILADLAEQVEERVAATGIDRDEARRISLAVARHMNAYWGGGLLYICKGQHYEIGLRDQEIYRRFNGENHDWLAMEYDLTVQHVYRIVKRVGAAERAKRQSPLFPEQN